MAPDDTRVHSELSANRTSGAPVSRMSNAANVTRTNVSSATHTRMMTFVTCLLIMRLRPTITRKNNASTDSATSMAPSVRMPSSVLV